LGKVIDRKRDIHGNPVSRGHNNPILDTRIYQVEFSDEHVKEFTANTIAECLYSQVDNEGKQYLLIEEIIDWEKDETALEEENKFQVSHNGNIHPRRTTKGWKICVLWKDGSTTWETLADMKEAFLLQVAQFATAHNLHNHIAFRWWIPQVAKHQTHIIKAIRFAMKNERTSMGYICPKVWKRFMQWTRRMGMTYGIRRFSRK